MFFASVLLASSLYFKSTSGVTYVAVDSVSPGTCVLGKVEELIYSETSVNTCQTIELEPGCYRVELRGGVGGHSPRCTDSAEQSSVETVSGIFSIDVPTTAYLFRGGDGVAGSDVPTSWVRGSLGGASSGVDSLFVVGDKAWRAVGAHGQTCGHATGSGAYNGGKTWANGVGGGSTLNNVDAIRGMCSGSAATANIDYTVMGGGGSGAPNGLAADTLYVSRYPCPSEFVVEFGADGTPAAGGNGGSFSNVYRYSDDTDTLYSARGGAGGKTVTWQCGGAMAYSYGGGGGGAVLYINGSNIVPIEGGAGGSGSTGTSNASFVRIYKI